jgi:ABC-2 type transport system ATP-binding protein
MANAITLANLTKTFGDTVAVRDFNLAVPEGALYGIIGPNGAGKTTIIRLILSILFADRGELTVLGKRSALEAKDRIGYLPEERGLYKKMRVGDFLAFMAQLKGVDNSEIKPRVRELLKRVELGSIEMKKCEELSKGMQQKVQFVAAIIHRPDLLILDEPFSGLDPVNQRLLRDLVVEEHKRGATVLFSTHIMIHAEQLCDHVVMIHKGEKVLDETIPGIRARFDPRSILFEPLDPTSEIQSLQEIDGVQSVRRDGAVWEIALADGADPVTAVRAIAAATAPARIELRRPTLEDVFIDIVEGTARIASEERTQLRASIGEAQAMGGAAMKKIFCVARREFLATVMTKAFIISVLVVPAMIGVSILVFPRLMNRTPPGVVGEVAIVDPTGQIAESLRTYLQQEQFAKRKEAENRQAAEVAPEAIKSMMEKSPQGQEAMQRQLSAAFGDLPQLSVLVLDPGMDLEQAKAPLKETKASGRADEGLRLALIVVHADAVERAPGKERFGAYDLYVRSKLDDRIESDLCNGVREAIVNARLKNSGLNRSDVDALITVARPNSLTVTAKAEKATNEVFNILLPGAFMFLLMISTLTSSQTLLTTTIEEKSSRVIEVLLSAVSPLELMAGKILGHMAAGFLILALYAGLGVAALFSFAMFGLLDPTLIVFLLIFFLFAYLTVAALMAAIGSAVNEIREAQGLMTPIMLLIMIPWMLWMPISRDPNSALALGLSFTPGIGNFIMLLRMASNSPPPYWQVGLSMVICAGGAVASIWAASKIFRIGLLMFGKPPLFGTLLRWIRMS